MHFPSDNEVLVSFASINLPFNLNVETLYVFLKTLVFIWNSGFEVVA